MSLLLLCLVGSFVMTIDSEHRSHLIEGPTYFPYAAKDSSFPSIPLPITSRAILRKNVMKNLRLDFFLWLLLALPVIDWMFKHGNRWVQEAWTRMPDRHDSTQGRDTKGERSPLPITARTRHGPMFLEVKKAHTSLPEKGKPGKTIRTKESTVK